MGCSERKREGPTSPGLQGYPKEVTVVKHLLYMCAHMHGRERGNKLLMVGSDTEIQAFSITLHRPGKRALRRKYI